MGPSLVGLKCRYKRFFPALVAVVGLVQNMFFLTVHYFSSFVYIAQQAGPAVVLGHLSLNICLLLKQWTSKQAVSQKPYDFFVYYCFFLFLLQS